VVRSAARNDTLGQALPCPLRDRSQRDAGVSHAFLYNHPNLRGRIERLRTQARPIPAPAPPADEHNALVLALTSQLTRLNKQHREEVQALRDALEQAHGENLDLRRELLRRG
jgi:hypothetical protein